MAVLKACKVLACSANNTAKYTRFLYRAPTRDYIRVLGPPRARVAAAEPQYCKFMLIYEL